MGEIMGARRERKNGRGRKRNSYFPIL